MHFKFQSIFSLVTFIFAAAHFSAISMIKDIDPQTSFTNCRELVGTVISFFASRFIIPEEIVKEKKVIQWGECSLNNVLALRTINKGFNSGIVYSFFPSILYFNTTVDNSTLHFQISRVMKMCASLDIYCVPNEFDLVKKWVSTRHESFITRSMNFLDVPNKEHVADLTETETDSAYYLFFQKDTEELLQKAVDQSKDKKKRKYAFLPCHSTNAQGYFLISDKVNRTLGGFGLNGFPKVRIPDNILDWPDSTSYVFLYNNDCREKIKEIGKNSVIDRINFISLYIVLDFHERMYWNTDKLIQNSCELFKKSLKEAQSLQKAHEGNEKKEGDKKKIFEIRNIVDVHFINDSLKSLDVLQKMRDALQACCRSEDAQTDELSDINSKFLVRAVFDEEYEDLDEYEDKCINHLLKRLRLKKSSLEAVYIKDIQYAKDIICYFLKNPKVKKGIGFLCDLIEKIQDESLIDNENILLEILEHTASRMTHEHLEPFLSYENTLDTRFSQYIIKHLPDELLEQVGTFCSDDKNILSHRYRFDVPFARYSCLLDQCVKKNFMTKEDQLTGVTNFCAINLGRSLISINFSNNQNRERIAVARELVRLTSLKNIKDIWEIHQTICGIAPTQSQLTNGTDPLSFRAKLYFLWYFKRIVLTPILAVCGTLLWKHHLLISKKFHELRQNL